MSLILLTPRLILGTFRIYEKLSTIPTRRFTTTPILFLRDRPFVSDIGMYMFDLNQQYNRRYNRQYNQPIVVPIHVHSSVSYQWAAYKKDDRLKCSHVLCQFVTKVYAARRFQ